MMHPFEMVWINTRWLSEKMYIGAWSMRQKGKLGHSRPTDEC